MRQGAPNQGARIVPDPYYACKGSGKGFSRGTQVTPRSPGLKGYEYLAASFQPGIYHHFPALPVPRVPARN